MNSGFNKDRVRKVRDKLQGAVYILNKALNEEINLTEASKKLGMTPQSLNQGLNHEFKHYIKSQFDTLTKDDLVRIAISLETPGERLLKTVFHYDSKELVKFPEFKEEELWILVQETLNERYYEVVCMRFGYGKYKEPLSYKEISKVMNCSQENIRQIMVNAARHLRHACIEKIFD